MGELRRFIKNNNLIMRITSLILTIAILASALVYFGDEKMDNVAAADSTGEKYMEYIVQRIINGLQTEFNILEIVPYQGTGEFRYYANDSSVKEGLEAKQDVLASMHGIAEHKFVNFSYTISKDSVTGKYTVDNPNTFTSYVLPEYKQLVDEVIKVNTVEANKITEADIKKADLIIINTGTSDAKVIECYKTFSGDTTAVYTKDGVEITDYTKITYNTFEKVRAEDVTDEGDVAVTTTGKIYFTNENNWAGVYAFYDTRTEGTSVATPGIEMTHVEGNVYCIDVPSDAYRIGFSNGTTNHAIPPVTIQGFDKVYYGGNWYDYPLILNPSKYAVTMPTDANIVATGEAEATQGAVYVVTLTPAEGYVVLDDTVAITIGEAEYKNFSYDSKTGEIAIPSDAVTGDIVINATAVEASTLSQYTVTLPTDTNIISVGETTATQGKLYTAILSAAEGYSLPETISVKVGDAEITDYIYEKETGKIVIPVAAVTGDIVISATAELIPVNEFAYISRDMAWSNCEILLDYVTKGRDLEISNGVVVSGVKTPVVIDGDGLSTLDKTSNIYKFIYTYRMCDDTNWDILKTYIRTYDSTGKRYRTNDGIVTAVIKSEDTGLAEDAIEWNIGDKNPIKALFDKVAAGTTFIESDPTKTNYLTSDYWVYTNSSSSKNWTIPKYYNESLTSDDSYNGKVDKVSNNYKAYNVLRYLLGAKSTQIYSFDKKLRVLEIQPCNSFDYDTLDKIKELGVAFLRTNANNWTDGGTNDYRNYISIDYVTTNALNGMTVDIASNYDVVIIGDNIELLTKDSSGNTIFNDRSLNGYIYLAFGDLIKLSTFLMGFLDDEYIELPASNGKNVHNITNSKVWTPYLYSKLKDTTGSGDYVIQDMYNYYKVNLSERYVTKKNVNGVEYYDYLKESGTKIDNESFYMDYCLGNARIPDNDITDITKAKLKEFVETGNPIIVADCVYNADSTKLYPTSDMYNFADEILGVKDASGNRTVRGNVVKEDAIGRAVAYLGNTAPEISFLKGNVQVITRSDQKNSSGKYTFTTTTESDMYLKPVSPDYTSGEGSAVKTFNSNKLYYKFKIYGVPNARYKVKLLIDKNNDGAYKDNPTSGNENEVYFSEIVTLDNTRSAIYEISSELSEDFAGMLSWKIEVVQVRDDDSETSYKVEEVGYSAIYREELKVIDVLQVTPGSITRNSNNQITWKSDQVHLLLESETFNTLFEDVKYSVGYDIKVTTKTVTEFNEMYNTDNERYVSGSDDYGYKSTRNQLKNYDMIILGFSDSFNHEDINNNYGAVDNIIDFVKAGNAMFLTHDTLSWRSTPNYYSAYLNSDGSIKYYNSNQNMYNVNVNGDPNTGAYKLENTSPTLTFKLRELMGMDKYGITQKDTYDPQTETNPREGKEVPVYGIGCIIPSYMATSSNSVVKKDSITGKEYYVATQEIPVRELQGFNSWILWRSNFVYRQKNNQTSVGNNYFGVRPYQNGDYMYYNRDSQGDYLNNVDNMTAKKIVNLNKGPITMFPYNIGTELRINETHGQYFELDMEDEELVVWYTLAEGDVNDEKTTTSKHYEAAAKDASNYYYIYSKGNITYSGAGHQNMDSNYSFYPNEYKLFVNTIVKAIAGSNTKPAIKLTNGSVVSDGKYVVYVDASSSAADYSIDFKAVDPDMISYETSNRNIDLVGVFERAEIYWVMPDGTPEGTLVKIKDRNYQATNRNGDSLTTEKLKNGMEQKLALGSTSLTAGAGGQLEQIKALVEAPNGYATFIIEVEDDAQSVTRVEVQLRIRDLFNMN